MEKYLLSEEDIKISKEQHFCLVHKGDIQKKSFEKSFGTWKLLVDEKKEIWDDLIKYRGKNKS